MIDLHSHIVPAVDDGAADLEVSLQMACMCVEEGIQTVVATPHVNFDYQNNPLVIGTAVGALNLALARTKIPLAVLHGAELALTRASGLDDNTLRGLCLGGSECLLVESPYVGGVPFLEDVIFDLQLRGFRPLLAHPERSPVFQSEPERLARLVQRDVMVSVTAGSMIGRFGTRVKRLTIELFREGLVHDVSSDAHDRTRRPPGLTAAFEQLDEELPGIAGQIDWFTYDVPAAILQNERLPPRPRRPSPAPTRWQRLTGRRAKG